MTLTWNTAAEWDAAQSQDGVIHETTTDLAAADVQPGYSPSMNGMVGLWPMDEDSNTAAVTDLVAGRDGTNSGAQSGQTKQRLNATSYYFFDTADRVAVSDAAAFDLDTFTLAAWIYPTSATRNRSILTHGVDAADQNWFFGLTSSGASPADALKLTIADTLGTTAGVTGATSLSMDTWYFVCATYDGSSLVVYLDGASDGSTSTTLTPADASSDVGIGGGYHSGNAAWQYGFEGYINWAMIFNRALSASEVSALSNTDGTLTTAEKVS